MKRRLLKTMKIASLFCLVNVSAILAANAQIEGDIRSRSNNAGWGSASTWQVYTAATNSWATSTVLPTTTSNVVLRDGFTHTTNGTGYTAASLTVGEGNAFRATGVLTGNALTGITIVDAGKLNSLSSGIGIYGACTTQATATISSVKVTGFSFNAQGTGYTTATVTLGTIWAPSVAYALNVQVNSGGNLYTCTTAGTSDATTGPTGTGATITDGTAVWKYAGVAATATANITGGAITSLNITNAGSGYTSIPSVGIVGDGTGAAYTTLVGVEAISITNGGAGYTDLPLITVGNIFMVGNATTSNRVVTIIGNVAFNTGANIISGGSTTAVTESLIIGGDLSAVTPISFRTTNVITTANTNVTFNKAGIATTSGANMIFNNLIVNAGTTLEISNNVTVLGTLTNNGTVNILSGGSLTANAIAGTGTLPVSLTSFSAKANLNDIKISWTTATEVNSAKFIIEKSTDGKTFSELASVEAKGPSVYTISDVNPVNGTNYYRLTQVDLDGKSKTFDPIAVNFSLKNEASLTVYPNPTSGGISFNADGLNGTIQASLVNMIGSVVYKENLTSNGTNNYTLNMKQKPAPGKYVLQVTGGGFSKSTIVIVL